MIGLFGKKINKSLKNEYKRSKYRKKGEQKEVKQILNETLFKYPCLKQPSHHLFGPLLSFTSIPLALATIQAYKVHTDQRLVVIFRRF